MFFIKLSIHKLSIYCVFVTCLSLNCLTLNYLKTCLYIWISHHVCIFECANMSVYLNIPTCLYIYRVWARKDIQRRVYGYQTGIWLLSERKLFQRQKSCFRCSKQVFLIVGQRVVNWNKQDWISLKGILCADPSF